MSDLEKTKTFRSASTLPKTAYPYKEDNTLPPDGSCEFTGNRIYQLAPTRYCKLDHTFCGDQTKYADKKTYQKCPTRTTQLVLAAEE